MLRIVDALPQKLCIGIQERPCAVRLVRLRCRAPVRPAVLTLDEARNKAMCRLVHEPTLAGHANCGQDVVTRHHDGPYARVPDLGKDSRRGGLQLVLEDDEPDEVEPGLGILPLHLLSLDPAQLRDVLRGDTDDAVALVRVKGEEFIIVIRD